MRILKTRPKSLIVIFIVLALCTCIDPYIPDLRGHDTFLVVEGLITDEISSYEIKLSRTIKAVNSIPEKVTDAVVTITDDIGHKTILKNFGNGLYKTDSTVFTGTVGKTYTLQISTGDGNEYKSEPGTMLPVPEIDSIYYARDEEFGNNQSEIFQGIRIYLDSKTGDETDKYYRWAYEETWKFKLPNPKRYNFVNDSTILPVDTVKEFCWRENKSTEILTSSMEQVQTGFIKKEPMAFLSPEISDRLSEQYSILVKQYSISKKEYEFWNNLKKVNETGGDIFGSQPFPVISNVSNINNFNERVLGYFQVSAVKHKRKYITFMELVKLYLPLFHYDCVRIESCPDDYACFKCTPLTFWDVYNMWDAKPYYSFVEPLYDPETKKLTKLVFTTRSCSDCELTGTLKKPDFWVDIN